MGVCWAGKTENNKVNSIKQQSVKINQAVDESSVKSKMTDCLLTFNTEKNELNTAIDRIINEYGQSLIKEKISKISFEQIYNIFIQYKFDFHNCKYIILDQRKNKKENFFKRFKNINYSINDLKMLSDEKINHFKNYLNDTNLIIILTNEDTTEFLEYLNFFIANNFNIANIYISDSNFNNDINNSEARKLLFSYIDDYLIVDYLPFILLSMRNFISLNSQQYLFYHEIENDGLNDNNFSKEHLTKKDIDKKGDKVLKLLKDFQIELIIKINEGENKKEIYEFQRKKLDEEEQKPLITIINLNLNDISQNNLKDLNDIFKTIKYELTKNEKCVLLQFNSKIKKNLLVQFLIIMIFKITKIKIDKMLEYMNKNYSLIFKDINTLYEKDKININNLLKEFGYK